MNGVKLFEKVRFQIYKLKEKCNTRECGFDNRAFCEGLDCCPIINNLEVKRQKLKKLEDELYGLYGCLSLEISEYANKFYCGYGGKIK